MDKIYISAYADDSFGTLSHASLTYKSKKDFLDARGNNKTYAPSTGNKMTSAWEENAKTNAATNNMRQYAVAGRRPQHVVLSQDNTDETRKRMNSIKDIFNTVKNLNSQIMSGKTSIDRLSATVSQVLDGIEGTKSNPKSYTEALNAIKDGFKKMKSANDTLSTQFKELERQHNFISKPEWSNSVYQPYVAPIKSIYDTVSKAVSDSNNKVNSIRNLINTKL